MLTTHYLEEAEALCSRLAMLRGGRVVALERTAQLLGAASGKVLRFRLESALPVGLAERARVTGQVVQLPVHDAQDLELTLAELRRAGLQPQELEISTTDLEEVFLRVMAQHATVGGTA